MWKDDEDRRVLTFYENQFYRSRLIINEHFQVCFSTPLPSRWRRFWYWLLLGWRWEKGTL